MNSNDNELCHPNGFSIFHKTPAIIRAIHEQERAREQKQGIEHYSETIKNWEYAYCVDCKQIRFSSELEATATGIRCTRCNGFKVEAPGWVVCPHYKDSLVKCPRAGKRIVKSEQGSECQDHCNFRLSAG